MERGCSWLILPLLLFLAAFLFLPALGVLVDAFRGPRGAAGLLEVLAKRYSVRAFRFSLYQALLSTLLSVALGYPAGYLVARYEFRGRRLLRSLSLTSFAAPTIVVALGFSTLFGHRSPLVRLLPSLHALGEGLTGILAAHAFYNVPLVLHVVSSSLERIDPEIEESSIILGDTGLRRFLKIELPQTLHALATASLLTFLYCFTSFAVPVVIGGVAYRTVEVEIYSNYRVYIDYQAAASLAAAQLAALTGVAALYARLAVERGALIEPGYGERSLARRPRGVAGALALTYISLLALFLSAPLLTVSITAFTNPYTGRLRLEVLAELLSPKPDPALGVPLLLPVLNSIVYSTIAALVAVTLSALAAASRVSRWIKVVVATAPLAISSAVLALGLYRVYVRGGFLEGSEWILVSCSYAVMAVPLAFNVLDVGLARVAPELVEAAYVLGDDWLGALVRVRLPLASSALLSAFALSLSVGLGEFTATLMLVKPEYTTMTVAVYRLLGARRFQEASLMSTILIACEALALLLAQVWGGGVERRG